MTAKKTVKPADEAPAVPVAGPETACTVWLQNWTGKNWQGREALPDVQTLGALNEFVEVNGYFEHPAAQGPGRYRLYCRINDKAVNPENEWREAIQWAVRPPTRVAASDPSAGVPFPVAPMPAAQSPAGGVLTPEFLQRIIESTLLTNVIGNQQKQQTDPMEQFSKGFDMAMRIMDRMTPREQPEPEPSPVEEFLNGLSQAGVSVEDILKKITGKD